MPAFSERTKHFAYSAHVMQGLFGRMTDKDIISFGGGAPAAELLPVEQLQRISHDVFRRDGRGIEALQYGPVLGLTGLRELVGSLFLAPNGVNAGLEEIMIVSGGIETMNLMCQLYIDPGDIVLCESPSFVQSMEVFELFGAECVCCDTDDDGIIPEDVEEKIKKYSPKMLYVIPSFQNPSGRTLSFERRRRIAELGSRYDILILEDDPYRELRYTGESLPYIKSFDKSGNTVIAGSFSKTFSPGSRLGFVNARPEIIAKLSDVKTATNSHSPMISQVLCEEFFHLGDYAEYLKRERQLYGERRDAMLKALEKYMPEGTRWSAPEGGLFIWVELPHGFDTADLLPSAEQAGVSYIPGRAFYPRNTDSGNNCMRISFGNVSPDKIDTGISRLGRLLIPDTNQNNVLSKSKV